MQATDAMVTAALSAYCGPDLNTPEIAMRAALEAALAAMWQPIEEAPTNTAILIKLPNLDYYGNNSVYAGMLVDMGTGKRWMTFGYAIGSDIRPDDWPTAWMPLPAPPSGG